MGNKPRNRGGAKSTERQRRNLMEQPEKPQRRKERRDFRAPDLCALCASAVEQIGQKSSQLAKILGYYSAEVSERAHSALFAPLRLNRLGESSRGAQGLGWIA